jgi:hypothetical protein
MTREAQASVAHAPGGRSLSDTRRKASGEDMWLVRAFSVGPSKEPRLPGALASGIEDARGRNETVASLVLGDLTS